MTLDDITKAAQERLDALDAEAKPHEDALATINAERARLRLIVAAGKNAPPLPIYTNPLPLIPEQPAIYPGGPQWVPPIAPSAFTLTGTTGTTAPLPRAHTTSGTVPFDPTASIVVPSCSVLS
jgi:hypothetical protein